jgi:N-acetylmuramoyl-L-alanine amidase
MFSSLCWHSRLLYYSLTREGGSLGFLLMLALPVCILAGLVYFAYSDGLRIEVLRHNDELTRQRDIDLRCLAENIYFEARGEPLPGQYAVAEVTLNRVASRYFPETICEVVHEKRWDPLRRRQVAAFSWTELEWPRPRGPAWEQAQAVALAVYDRMHQSQVPGALFYHATYIKPSWARQKKRVAKIGNHVFYR